MIARMRQLGRAALNTVVGATAAALLFTAVPKLEGTILKGYRDPIGIVTACTGHTKTAVLGMPYTPEQCRVMLEDDLVEHAVGVLACTPQIKGNPYVTAAATSFAFNNGVRAYCTSTLADLTRAGNLRAAADQFGRWVCATVKPGKGVPLVPGKLPATCATKEAKMIVLPGLVKRRVVERDMWLQGVPA